MTCKQSPSSKPAAVTSLVWDKKKDSVRMMTGFNVDFYGRSRKMLRHSPKLYTSTKISMTSLVERNTVKVVSKKKIPTSRSSIRFISHGHYWHNWKYETINNCSVVNRQGFQRQLKLHIFHSWRRCKKRLKQQQKQFKNRLKKKQQEFNVCFRFYYVIFCGHLLFVFDFL